VPFKLPLNSAQSIRARAGQILLGIVKIVLIKLKLCLLQVQLLLNLILVRPGGGSQLLVELIYLILVGLDRRLSLVQAGVQFPRLGCGLSRMIGGITECIFKSQVHFMIGGAQSLIRESLLIPSAG